MRRYAVSKTEPRPEPSRPWVTRVLLSAHEQLPHCLTVTHPTRALLAITPCLRNRLRTGKCPLCFDTQRCWRQTPTTLCSRWACSSGFGLLAQLPVATWQQPCAYTRYPFSMAPNAEDPLQLCQRNQREAVQNRKYR